MHSELHHHTHIDPHSNASALADVILGGQDGLVNVLGVILGVAAATGDPRIVMAAAWLLLSPNRSQWELWHTPPRWPSPIST